MLITHHAVLLVFDLRIAMPRSGLYFGHIFCVKAGIIIIRIIKPLLSLHMMLQ